MDSTTIQVDVFWKDNPAFINNELVEIDIFLKNLYVERKYIESILELSIYGITNNDFLKGDPPIQFIKLYKFIREIHFTRRNGRDKYEINPHISIKLKDNSDIRYYFFPKPGRDTIVYSGGLAEELKKIKNSYLYLFPNANRRYFVTIEDIFDKLIKNIYVKRLYSPDVNRAIGKKIKLKHKKQRTRTKPKSKNKSRMGRFPHKPKKQRTRTRTKHKPKNKY